MPSLSKGQDALNKQGRGQCTKSIIHALAMLSDPDVLSQCAVRT